MILQGSCEECLSDVNDPGHRCAVSVWGRLWEALPRAVSRILQGIKSTNETQIDKRIMLSDIPTDLGLIRCKLIGKLFQRALLMFIVPDYYNYCATHIHQCICVISVYLKSVFYLFIMIYASLKVVEYKFL